MTKVLVVNGSPRMEKGNTARVLVPFIQGMKEAGADIDLIYAKKMNIKGCIGEFHCWREKIGECIFRDDMDDLYPLLKQSDIFVIATPVYIPLPGEMQDLINRLCPLLDPTLEFRNGRTRIRFRKDVNISKIVLVGTSGWWEIQNLDTILRIAEEIALDASVEFTGAILRPHSSLMTQENEKTREVYDSLRAVGRQLIAEGKMDRNLLKAISQPLVTREEYFGLED